MKQRVPATVIILGPIQGGLYETKIKTSTRAVEIYNVDHGSMFFLSLNFLLYMQTYAKNAI